jgi:hypothetical protein
MFSSYLLSLLVVSLATGVIAQTPPVGTPIKPKVEAKPAPSAATAQAQKAEAPEPTIDGYVISRANGGFLGVTMNGLSMRVAFYDAKKKPVAPDVARALARFRLPAAPSEEIRSILNLGGDGVSLVSLPQFRRPLTYNVRMAFISADGQEDTQAGEAYAFNLNQLPPPADAETTEGAAPGPNSVATTSQPPSSTPTKPAPGSSKPTPPAKRVPPKVY